MLRSSQEQSAAFLVQIAQQQEKRVMRQQSIEQQISQYSSLKDKILDKTANAMWNCGYPATHMLLSHFIRKSILKESTILPLICIAAAFEIVEEFF